jgi:hypothetical protein
MNKVFCIGIWKTATTSVGNACNTLLGGDHDGNIRNYPNRGNSALYVHDFRNDYDKRKEKIDFLIKDYSTFDDAPWNTGAFIDILAKSYPDYGYVLTVRDVDEWHYSAYSFYRKQTEAGLLNPYGIWSIYSREFVWVLGDIPNITQIVKSDYSGMVKNKSLWVDWFHQRNEKVKSLFKNNLLELDISSKLEWGPICKFLGKEIPNIPFPKLNVQTKKEP